ncbi:site-2 protease family protein [Candidatus Parcubacteria bacterium]|nr:site-2 protease family protein [Candidatus Parcubacteria bacterium]
MDIIFSIAILIMSVVIHEVSHGYAALFQGDPTAKHEGRLTLNPIKHLDPFGSFLVPLVTYLTAGFAFGWAKPVPYNPYNLRNQRWGELVVAIAGPISNIVIAVIFGLILRFYINVLPFSTIQLMGFIVAINLGLAVFNLIPIPPLDGSKVLFAFLPFRFREFRHNLERYSFILIIIAVLILPEFLSGIVSYLFGLITGLA